MYALVLAGGAGTRLWPMSRELYAKQFLKINSEYSFLQQTIKNVMDSCSDLVIVTNNDQYFLVKHQVKDLGVSEGNIIKEPVGKNTAPAIALGCRFIQENHGSGDVLVMPSDHILESNFFDVVEKAKKYTEDYLCTFGVKPTSASTGYGYIRKSAKRGDGYLVQGFFEKPDDARAKEYVSSGEYLWNSGIFLFRTEKILGEIGKNLPEVKKYLSSVDELLENYKKLSSISIDYAVMEKAKEIMVFPFSGKWSDIGSWDSVYSLLKKDEKNNAIEGDVLSVDTKNSLIIGEDRLIATLGLDDMVLVDTKDALLVADLSRTEEIKKIVEALSADKRTETSLHATVYRPWGYYTVLESGERYKVKRIAIYPKESISHQLHHHRAEHWIVVKGTARITKGNKTVSVHENESFYVPKSTEHRVENPGKLDLHIIEIQTGEYVEEDDIVRFQDKYGRK